MDSTNREALTTRHSLAPTHGAMDRRNRGPLRRVTSCGRFAAGLFLGSAAFLFRSFSPGLVRKPSEVFLKEPPEDFAPGQGMASLQGCCLPLASGGALRLLPTYPCEASSEGASNTFSFAFIFCVAAILEPSSGHCAPRSTIQLVIGF